MSKKGVTLKLQEELKVRGKSIAPAPGVAGGTTVLFMLNTLLNTIPAQDNKSIMLIVKAMDKLDENPELEEIELNKVLVQLLDAQLRSLIQKEQMIPALGYKFLGLLGTLEEDED